MATTGTAVIDRLNSRFDDTSNSKFSSAVKIDAINAAIDASFPIIKTVMSDSSVTLVSQTFEYTPTAIPELAFGYSQAYVTVAGNPKVLLRRVAQRRNAAGTGWIIIVPADLVSEFNSQVMTLMYNGRTSNITSSTDSIALPKEYLEAYASFYLCAVMALKAAQFEVSPYAQMMKMFEEQSERYKNANRSGHMAQTIPIVFERGGGDINMGVFSDGMGRYGQNIVQNP